MHIVHVISSLQLGGAEAILTSLVQQFAQKGYRQSVIYFYEGPHKAKIESYGVPTYHIQGFMSLYDPLFLFRLYGTIKKLKPNILHSALWAANFLSTAIARSLRIPIVSAIHAQRSVEGSVRNKLDRLYLPYTSHIIAISSVIQKQITTELAIAPAQITVIENSIALERNDTRIESLINRYTLGIPEDAFVIGSVGRFVSVKQYPFLIRMLAPLLQSHSDMYLVLVGSGPDYAQLKQVTHDLAITHKVHFVTNQLAQPYYALFDCFILASDCEALSLVLLEAMRAQVPCIMHGKQYHDILSDGIHGLIFTCQEELIAAVYRYYAHPALRQTIAQEALQFLQHRYSLDHMINTYEQVFIKTIQDFTDTAAR